MNDHNAIPSAVYKIANLININLINIKSNSPASMTGHPRRTGIKSIQERYLRKSNSYLAQKIAYTVSGAADWASCCNNEDCAHFST